MLNITFSKFVIVYFCLFASYSLVYPLLLLFLKKSDSISNQEKRELHYKYLLIANPIKGRTWLSLFIITTLSLSLVFLFCNFGAYGEGGYNPNLVKMPQTTIASLNAFLSLLFLSLCMFFKILDRYLVENFFYYNEKGITFYQENKIYCDRIFLTKRLFKIEILVELLL